MIKFCKHMILGGEPMKCLLRISTLCLVVLSLFSTSFSATWSGGGSDDYASTADNWLPNITPSVGAGIIFDATAKNCEWDLSNNLTSFIIGGGYSGAVIMSSGLSLVPGLAQPNNAVIPSLMGCNGGQPSGLAPLLACQCTAPGICNIGTACPSLPCDNGVHGICETTLWHNMNDNPCIPSNLSGLDPRLSAAAQPETFLPSGDLTFKLISRGNTAFQNVLGWYNVTGSSPVAADLHVVLGCSAAAGTEVLLNVLSDPSYLEGRIGFFVITPESHSAHGTCAGGDCCASIIRLQTGQGYIYYSERSYNSDWAGLNSFIHLLIYRSGIWANKFYFAFDDRYGGGDNDFTDMMTGVSGIGN